MLILVSRTSSVEQIGCFGIAFTTAQILYIVGQFGIAHYQMTDYAEKYSFKTYLLVRCFSGALMFTGCALTSAFLQFNRDKLLYTAALTVLMLVNVFGDVYQSLFFQKNRLDLSGSALFYRTLVSLAAFCAVIIASGNILAAIILQVAVNIIITVFYAVKIAPKYSSLSGPVDKKELVSVTVECFPLFISLLFMNIVINMSKYGVDAYLDDTAQGYFNMIFMPVQVINLCSQFIFKPYLNRYAEELEKPEKKGFIGLMTRQALFISGLTAVCCLGAFFFGAPVLGFLYGKDISAHVASLVTVLVGGGFYALCQLYYYIFVILRKQKSIMWIYCFALVLSAAAAVVFIKRFGLYGAAVSFSFVHFALLCCYTLSLYHILKKGYNA